jgi:hypothetical protein
MPPEKPPETLFQQVLRLAQARRAAQAELLSQQIARIQAKREAEEQGAPLHFEERGNG